MASGLGLSTRAANAVRSIDEHWDGGGDPIGLQGEAIPLLARIMGLAQIAEVFSHSQGETIALDVIERRRNRWFDPTLVDAFGALVADAAFWQALRRDDVTALVRRVEPARVRIVADESRLDQIADAFASLIDAKSPYTSDHSRRVAHLSVCIGERLGFAPWELTRLRRAALLHDIGKLGVPSVVLEKPWNLTPAEWVLIKRHPAHTLQILMAVPGFHDFAFDAACHHEKLDGSGYHCGYAAQRLSPTARVLTVADMADALMTDRPYRQGFDPLETLRIIHADCLAGQLCQDSVGALTDYVAEARADPRADDDRRDDRNDAAGDHVDGGRLDTGTL